MSKTYNGRFRMPPEGDKGTLWLVLGLLMIPAWSIPFVKYAFIAGSIGCFVTYGNRKKAVKQREHFMRYCAVIGHRGRVPVKELAKAVEDSVSDTQRELQTLIAKGYFGEEAYLDVNARCLVVNAAAEDDVSEGAATNWVDVVKDLIHTLRGDHIFDEPVRDAEYSYNYSYAANAGPARTEAPKAQAEPPKAQSEAPKAESAEPEAPKAAEKPRSREEAKKSYMDELERTLGELYQLNAQIDDEAVSARIDRIGELTAGIFRAVIENPEREQDVRKFMNYYLPTTLKLLKSYDLLEDQSYQGENIVASRRKIESVLDMLIEAYEKQLDKLFRNDALDIATDIDVLETMIAGDGLSSKGQMQM